MTCNPGSPAWESFTGTRKESSVYRCRQRQPSTVQQHGTEKKEQQMHDMKFILEVIGAVSLSVIILFAIYAKFGAMSSKKEK